MAMRLGAGPVEDSIFTGSDQVLFANRVFFDEIESRFETDARTHGNADRSLRRDGDLGRNNVFGPVAVAGRHVTRKREIGERRERNIVRPADAGFKHPAAPHGDPMMLAEIVNAARH